MLMRPTTTTTTTYQSQHKVSALRCRDKKFLQAKAQMDETWRFWIQFVFTDALAYVGLYLAIRSGDWCLRVACIKEMAALFTAFDHQTYQKLITQHLCDIHNMNPILLSFFKQGAFVVNVKGRPWHAVAIDEAHEMLINKSCKTSIVKPNPDFISRISRYLPHRTKILENLIFQVLPTITEQKDELIEAFISQKSVDIETQKNIERQIKCLNEHALFSNIKTELRNPFTQVELSKEQAHDLMNFRHIGQRQFLLRIKAVVLKQPSVKAPNRKNNLKTFTEKKRNSRQISKLEKDKQLVLSAMRRKMSFSKRTGQPIHELEEQLIELPLAICDSNENTNKGQKSYSTKHYEARYHDAIPTIFDCKRPWTPEVIIMEGMFLINVTPLNQHKTLPDYCKFLMERFIVTEFKKGCQEIHVIFDNPGSWDNHQNILSKSDVIRSVQVVPPCIIVTTSIGTQK